LLTIHGYDVHFENEKELNVLREKYKVSFKNAKSVYINTSYLKDKVLALNCPEKKIKVVPIGIDLDFYKPMRQYKSIDKNEVIKLISVGRLIELKGHKYGVKAVKLLVDKGYTVNYTIIGEGKLYNELDALIKKLQLEKHITLYGKGTQEQVKTALEESHIFLMTSVKDSNGREEAQGIVTAEAQNMGLPIVGFKSGGIATTVTKDTSVLVEQKNFQAISDAIIDIVNTEDKLLNMSLAAQKWAVSNFGLKQMINNYYKRIL
jgi:colanic acid/amylovoran biosynthesis glycosyltransferase